MCNVICFNELEFVWVWVYYHDLTKNEFFMIYIIGDVEPKFDKKSLYDFFSDNCCILLFIAFNVTKLTVHTSKIVFEKI